MDFLPGGMSEGLICEKIAYNFLECDLTKKGKKMEVGMDM
jgi:hypothetical protein